MTDEQWVEIRDFPNYLVSNLGRVCTWQRGIVLKPRLSGWGYLQVMLSKEGKSYTKSVHKLVAQEFVPGEDVGLEVNHIDGDKSNNSELNLEWVTKGMNNQHAIDHGLRNPRGVKIRINETGEIFASVKECAEFLGTWPTAIGVVLNGRRPHYKGLTFSRC